MWKLRLFWKKSSRYQFFLIKATRWKEETGSQREKRTEPDWKYELQPCIPSLEWEQANYTEQERTVFRRVTHFAALRETEKDPPVSLHTLRAWRFIQLARQNETLANISQMLLPFIGMYFPFQLIISRFFSIIWSSSFLLWIGHTYPRDYWC